jgi:hypothetical protein
MKGLASSKVFEVQDAIGAAGYRYQAPGHRRTGNKGLAASGCRPQAGATKHGAERMMGAGREATKTAIMEASRGQTKEQSTLFRYLHAASAGSGAEPTGPGALAATGRGLL